MPPTDQMDAADFAKKIKAKYPQYANLPDDSLVQKVLAKYPQYRDVVRAAPQTPGASDITGISAGPPKLSGIREKLSPKGVEQWAENVRNDVKYGTDVTGVGTILKKMGAHGVYSGNSEAVGDYMASLPLGLLRGAKGIAESDQPGKRVRGVKDIIAGGAQASTIPGSVIAPEAAEAGASKVSGAVPSVKRAGKAFEEVAGAVGKHPVEMTDALSKSATRIQQLADTGSTMPQAVRKFLTRVTNPERPPLSYSEARDFYSNMTRLSADEAQRLTPVMRRALGQFTHDLGEAITDVTERGGKLEQFQKAMREYRLAMKARDAGEKVGKYAGKALPWVGTGLLTGAAGAGAYHAVRIATD